MSKMLNILAALLLAILPVAAPCSAHGFTLLCTCSGYEAPESETDEAESPSRPVCPCCGLAEATAPNDHDQPAPAKPCGGGDKRSVPDAAYSAEVVPQVEFTTAAHDVSDSGDCRQQFGVAVGSEPGPICTAPVGSPPSTAPPWGLIVAATARILV